jgi:A/G-specific adenine glycosylase
MPLITRVKVNVPPFLLPGFLSQEPAMAQKLTVLPRLAHPSTIRAFQRRLINWYSTHGRDLPWRRTRDPYAILVSEVMLQQTQVQRAMLYYDKFLQRYPTVEELARADEGEVRETWEGLGYYARARNLQRTAQKIVTEHKGRFPKRPQELTALPGIGQYTAGAVLSFAFRRDAAILDTNAARVLTRFFALPPEQQTTSFLWTVARQVTPPGQAHLFNQAIMDLGATTCVARTPRCPVCPLRQVCRYTPSSQT